ncbi:MAG: hypothetical protein M3N57_03720 [Actinomycetota bacterium]|nr:hypothetical protein [Actinomycetota bacterium]
MTRQPASFAHHADLRPLTGGRLAVVIAAVAFLAGAAAAGGVAGRATTGNHTSGDEPHYLLTALSLAHDLDLDVSDQIDRGAYRPFHEQTLLPQARRRADGSMVAPHDPLLPAVLSVPVRLGGWVAAKLTLAGLNAALAGLLVWTMVRRFGVPLRTAAVTALVMGAAAPLAVYGQQVYPELPAAVAVTAAIAGLAGPLRRGGIAVVTGAVVALPWLSVKFVPVAASLAGLAVVRVIRRGDRVTAGVAVGVLAVAGIAYLALHLAWYGGATSYASGAFFAEHGGQLAVVGLAPRYLARSQRLLGLLVDRGFGVAAWQPAWLLAVPALAALARRSGRAAAVVGVPLIAGWLTATFVAVTMHGWWFPGRQIVAVLPCAAVAVGWWVGRNGARLTWLAVLGTVGVVAHAWLAVEAARGDVTWVVDFAATTNPLYRGWRLMLPDYLRPGVATWVRHGAWVVAAVALAGWGWTGASVGAGRGGRAWRRRCLGARLRAGLRARLGPRHRVAAPVDLADAGAVVATTGGQHGERQAGRHDEAGREATQA